MKANIFAAWLQGFPWLFFFKYVIPCIHNRQITKND